MRKNLNGFISRRESKPQRSAGFTLVEILVIIGILTVMGIILTEIFFRSARSSSKTEIISRIKQNGQATLETMDKTLRAADGVVCTNSPTNSVILFKIGNSEDESKVYIRYRYNPATSSQNGSISVDYPASADCNAPVINQAFLTDTGGGDVQSGVSVSAIPDTSGVFVHTKGVKDIININFEINAPVNTPVYLQQLDPVSFQTTVELR